MLVFQVYFASFIVKDGSFSMGAEWRLYCEALRYCWIQKTMKKVEGYGRRRVWLIMKWNVTLENWLLPKFLFNYGLVIWPYNNVFSSDMFLIFWAPSFRNLVLFIEMLNISKCYSNSWGPLSKHGKMLTGYHAFLKKLDTASTAVFVTK